MVFQSISNWFHQLLYNYFLYVIEDDVERMNIILIIMALYWILIPVIAWYDQKKYYKTGVHLEGKELYKDLFWSNFLECLLFTLGYVLCYIQIYYL
jgi:hypothetical protein